MSIPDRATWGSAIEGRALLCPVPGKCNSRGRAGGLLDAGDALEL